MKELFEDLYMEFFPDTESSTKRKQLYYDCITKLILEGEGLLPDLKDSDEMVQRKLTNEETEELSFRLEYWLESLN